MVDWIGGVVKDDDFVEDIKSLDFFIVRKF